MSGARRPEDLVAWQLCMDLDACIFDITAEGPIARDFNLRDQIRAAAGSAAPNIAEGFGRYGSREFVRYLRIAIGSLLETATHLERGRGRGYFTDEAHAKAATLCGRALRMTRRLLRSKLDQIAREEAERPRKTTRPGNRRPPP